MEGHEKKKNTRSGGIFEDGVEAEQFREAAQRDTEMKNGLWKSLKRITTKGRRSGRKKD